MIRSYLLVVLALLIGLVSAMLLDRHVLGPHREAARMIDEARPHASSTNAAEWLTAESLLAKAELLHKGEPAIAELRKVIADKRLVAKAEDEKILGLALTACLGALDKAGRSADARALEAELGKAPTRELHVRCVRSQLESLSLPAALSASASAASSAPLSSASVPGSKP